MENIKDTIINIVETFVSQTDIETRKKLYLENWDGYYTQKATTDLNDEVIEMIDLLFREGELQDMEVFCEIQHDYAVQYLKEEYDIDFDEADDEQIEEAYDNNFFTETGSYAFTNYFEVIVDEPLRNIIKEQRQEEVDSIVNEVRSTFVSQGIILNNKVDIHRDTYWEADITTLTSVDEEWTIQITNYDDETSSIDVEINHNGFNEYQMEGLVMDDETYIDVINRLKEMYEKHLEQYN